MSETVAEEAVAEGVAAQEAVAQEAVAQEAVAQQAVAQEAVAQEAVAQEATSGRPAVALIGLGAMGLPMATHLAGHLDVTGYDPSPERCALAADAGLRVASSPAGAVTAAAAAAGAAGADAAGGATVVVLCVRTLAQVEGALWSGAAAGPADAGGDTDAGGASKAGAASKAGGAAEALPPGGAAEALPPGGAAEALPPGGAAEALPPGGVVIVTSTIGSPGARSIAARLEAQGLLTLDLPVSGGPARAGTGELLAFRGGPDRAVAAAGPVPDLIASTIAVVGPDAGDGQAMKTVNQLLCGVHIAAAAEALALAKGLGIEPGRALDALGEGAAASWMLANRGPRIVEALAGDTPEVLSRVDIFEKDLGIVSAAGRDAGVALPVAAAAEQLYRLARLAGLGAADDGTIATLLGSQETGSA